MKPKLNPRYGRYQLRVSRSRIHSYGLFALEDIPRGKQVIQYTGKRIPLVSALDYTFKTDRYLVRLNDQWVIDGRHGGSGAEIVNHSCEPNLIVRREKGGVFFFSRRKIRAGEELTFRYGYATRVTRVPCHCKSPNCRGTLRYIFH